MNIWHMSLIDLELEVGEGKQSEKKGKPMMGPTMKSIFGEQIRLASFKSHQHFLVQFYILNVNASASLQKDQFERSAFCQK